MSKRKRLLRKLKRQGLRPELIKQFAEIGPDALPAMLLLTKQAPAISAANDMLRRIEREHEALLARFGVERQ